MKRLAILSAIALSGLLYNTANAQIRVSVGLHLGIRPVTYVPATEVVEQAPIYDENDQVYDDSNDDDYYYLPDVDAYYNVNAQSYYYYNGDNWITCAYLPGPYRNFDWRTARRFEVREHRPYMRNDFYRSRFNGREMAVWRNFNRGNNYGRNEYYNRDAYMRNDNHFDNRDNRFNRPEAQRGDYSRFDNRGQDRFSQPLNRDNGGFNQPNQNRGNDRGQNERPVPQNSGNQNRDNRGGNEHFAQNNRPMFVDHRPGRF